MTGFNTTGSDMNGSDKTEIERYELADEQATLALGAELATVFQQRFPAGAVVFLNGDLGAGKTTLARGILRGLGFSGTVRSPTYTLVERYSFDADPAEASQVSAFQVCHFDLYRMGDPDELEFLGARDDLQAGNLCLIEWSERAHGCLGHPDVEVCINVVVDKPINHLKKSMQVTKITRHIEIYWHNRQHE